MRLEENLFAVSVAVFEMVHDQEKGNHKPKNEQKMMDLHVNLLIKNEYQYYLQWTLNQATGAD